jgi:hypothetical protein
VLRQPVKRGTGNWEQGQRKEEREKSKEGGSEGERREQKEKRSEEREKRLGEQKRAVVRKEVRPLFSFLLLTCLY